MQPKIEFCMNEVTIDHINHLTDIQLSKLLHSLIRLEAEKNNLQEWDGIVPLNITTTDAGSDGRIKWNGVPAETHWLKNKFTIFQNKATDLFPFECIEEILETAKEGQTGRKLKAQIEKLVIENGCYVLFTNRALVDNGKDERIKKFREAIKIAGHSNFDTFQILIYDSNSIKDWVNENIAAVTLVQGFNNISRPNGFILWERWEILSKAKDNKFQIDKNIEGNLALIQETIKNEKVIRITGHSGLGKSRLVLEAFRNSDLKTSVVYVNLEGTLDISEIKGYILSHQDHQTGIVVLDNCDVKSHMILSGIAKPIGSLKIVTIGLDDSNSIEDFKIKVERNKQRDIVKNIILEKIGTTHQNSDVEYINTISEGYPWMAIRFCDIVLKEGMSELNKIPLEEFIRKLIFGLSPEDKIEYDVIRACSVFSAFGFLDDSFRDIISKEVKNSLKEQMDYIRTRIYDGVITETKFKEICLKFKQDDIIEKRGTHYIVKPTILAINLAADWLIKTDSDRIIKIIQELKEVNLDEKFVDRLKDLDQLDKAKDIVAELWGPNSPFGIAEVLNTAWGSLLFRYVVEVNPIATTKTLENSFGKLTKNEILGIIDGRRNLVWALEKLCFRKETFNTAAKILYSFAVSENETWANNATNQFIQLFQLILSGTEANLNSRLDIIKWGLDKNDDDYTRIAIIALGRGLMNDNFTRMGGPEKQGSGTPLKDYYPGWGELVEYRNQIISILTEISCSNNESSLLAQETIAQSIRGILKDNQFKVLIDSIRKIVSIKGNLWPSALNNLRMTLGFEKRLSKETKDQIDSLILDLTPTDIKNQLFLKVTKPEWDTYEKGADGHYIDKPKISAESFAQKVLEEKLQWTDYLVDLVQGEQRQGFNFGNKIGELSPDIHSILELTIKALKSVSKENQNSEFLGGLLYGSKNNKLSEYYINRIIENNDLRQHAFYLTRVTYSNYNDIENLFKLVDEYGFSIYQFQIFRYGRALDKLAINDVLSLCKKISDYGCTGKWTSLSILYMFSFNNNDSWQYCKDYLKEIILNTNLIVGELGKGQIEPYHWSDTVIKLLAAENDPTFAITISKQIVEFCSQDHFNYSFDTYLKNVILAIFDKYFNSTWVYFGEGIIGEYITFFNLKHLIGTQNGFPDSYVGIAFKNPENFETIISWCRINPEIGPERIANMMPLNESNETKWHPLSKKIIDEFGDNDKLLSNLNSNMGTYGITGSSIPYLITQKLLLEQLTDHKYEKVRSWSKMMLDYTEKALRREQIDDEELGL